MISFIRRWKWLEDCRHIFAWNVRRLANKGQGCVINFEWTSYGLRVQGARLSSKITSNLALLNKTKPYPILYPGHAGGFFQYYFRSYPCEVLTFFEVSLFEGSQSPSHILQEVPVIFLGIKFRKKMKMPFFCSNFSFFSCKS